MPDSKFDTLASGLTANLEFPSENSSPYATINGPSDIHGEHRVRNLQLVPTYDHPSWLSDDTLSLQSTVALPSPGRNVSVGVQQRGVIVNEPNMGVFHYGDDHIRAGPRHSMQVLQAMQVDEEPLQYRILRIESNIADGATWPSHLDPKPFHRRGKPPESPKEAEKLSMHNFEAHGHFADASESELSTITSALYGILVTIVSSCLAISSTLTNNLDSNYARWFDSTLMALSLLWISFAFLYLFRPPHQRKPRKHPRPSSSKPVKTQQKFIQHPVDSGSFYLKMGATLFGVGGMIYSCLQLGVFVENTSCFDFVMGVNPCLFILFIMFQLYFIFKNSQFKITKYRAISRFGLMHLVATDLTMWIRTLLDETLLEFDDIQKAANKSGEIMVESDTQARAALPLGTTSLFRAGALGYNPLCVDESSPMQEMLNRAAMFLFPCIIEYTLICAGVVFLMWQIVGTSRNALEQELHAKHPRIFSIDCTHAANGLFAGIMVIVLTIIGLIMFFLLDNDSTDARQPTMAAITGDIMDIALNTLGIAAVVYCGIVFGRKLHAVPIHTANMALDDGLLILTMIGVYGFSVVSILGTFGDYSGTDNVLDTVASILEIVQSTIQTAFLVDASKRVLFLPLHINGQLFHDPKSSNLGKPAREMIMFLLANNFAQWALNIGLGRMILFLAIFWSKLSPLGNAYPYVTLGWTVHKIGPFQWAVLLHTTVPLVIFYRFHSTVCLFDIWKRAYKEPHPRKMDIALTPEQETKL